MIEDVNGKTDGEKRTLILSPLRAFTHKKISSFLSNLLSKSFGEWHFKIFFRHFIFLSGFGEKKILAGERDETRRGRIFKLQAPPIPVKPLLRVTESSGKKERQP
jgi:hypothetical protein